MITFARCNQTKLSDMIELNRPGIAGGSNS
jgi:hypothetical protein